MRMKRDKDIPNFALTILLFLLLQPSTVVSQFSPNWDTPYFPPSLCNIPPTIHGEWFSRENGVNTYTVIDGQMVNTHGRCVESESRRTDNITLVLQNPNTGNDINSDDQRQ